MGDRSADNGVARRRPDGRYDLVLADRNREVLAVLLDELEGALDRPDDPSLRRLNPPAYLDDADRDAEYQLLAGDELRTSRRTAIDAVRSSLDHRTLTEDAMWSWLQAVNTLRLVVGTRLDITDDEDDVPPTVDLDDPDDPRALLWNVYDFTTWLQYSLVVALRS